MEKDAELRALLALRQKSWGKIVFHLKKKYEDWLIQQLTAKGYPHFKMSYMQLLMYIETDGSISNDLAIQANITRQAMSKVVKELEEEGFIVAKEYSEDKRVSRLFLTKKGKVLMYEILKCLDTLTKEYKEVIGNEKFETALQAFIDILEYHDSNLLKENLLKTSNN